MRETEIESIPFDLYQMRNWAGAGKEGGSVCQPYYIRLICEWRSAGSSINRVQPVSRAGGLKK